jgi:hypothetical protein
VQENVIISFRGASYEIGRGKDFYGIWVAGAPRTQPSEQWPETPEGWHGAWSRFVGIERPDTIVAVGNQGSRTLGATPTAIVAASLLALGVALGVVGLFPDYLGGLSLAQQASEVVAHAFYLAAWSASAVLIFLGGRRLRVGALLGLGTTVVTFGLFFADVGSPIAYGAHIMGAGLVLSLLGWVACAAGGVLVLRVAGAGAPGRPHGHALGFVLALALAAIGAAIAFAPSWDSFTLRTSTGVVHTLTAGNAFSSPGAVIAGNLVTMIAFVLVGVVAALWRPPLIGGALLAGAVLTMVAQAISALVQLTQTVPPSQFGISSAEAARAGLTISSGVTPDFWIFCAFVLALVAMCVRLLIPMRQPTLVSTPTATTTFG